MHAALFAARQSTHVVVFPTTPDLRYLWHLPEQLYMHVQASQSAAAQPKQAAAVVVPTPPQHARPTDGLTAAAPASDPGFAAHAAHAPINHPSSCSTIAAAASMSEHTAAPHTHPLATSSGGGGGGSDVRSQAPAASIAEPLVCCPHACAAGSATSAAAKGTVELGVARIAVLSMDRLVGVCGGAGAAGKDVAGLWAGSSGLLHLQHPLGS